MLSTLSLVTLIARERDDLFVYINLKFQLQNLWPDNTKEPNKQLPYVHTSKSKIKIPNENLNPYLTRSGF